MQQELRVQMFRIHFYELKSQLNVLNTEAKLFAKCHRFFDIISFHLFNLPVPKRHCFTTTTMFSFIVSKGSGQDLKFRN